MLLLWNMLSRLLLRCDICSTIATPLTKAVKYPPPPFPGIYSGIFVLYLQYHASKTDTVQANNNILFYGLCLLYVLSVATIGFDIVSFVITTKVSNNERLFFNQKLSANHWLDRTIIYYTPSILSNTHYSFSATPSPSPS